MSRISEILSFNFDLESYTSRAKGVVTKFVSKDLERRAIEIDTIAQTMANDGCIIDNSLEIGEYISAINDKSSDVNYSRSILRTLCYYLYMIKSVDCLSFLFDKLDTKWNNSYLYGILDYVFQFWDLNDSKFLFIRKFLISKISKYVGSNAYFKNMAEHIDFFDDNAPEILGVKLRLNNESIFQCTKILNMGDSKITYKYFSFVIYSYFSYKGFAYDCSELEAALDAHNNLFTDKITISYAIVSFKSISRIDKNKLISLSKRRIGDCETNASWSPPHGANSDQQRRLKEAQKLVHIWTTEKYITLFFENCVDDPLRKQYWLQYVKFIQNIRLAGSAEIKWYLSNDIRFKPLLGDKFITISGRCRTTAFIMFIENKVFIEFSDVGALYVYEEDKTPIKKLDIVKNISSIADLKDTNMLNLVANDYYYGTVYNETGRLVHIGSWPARLTQWFRAHNIYI